MYESGNKTISESINRLNEKDLKTDILSEVNPNISNLRKNIEEIRNQYEELLVQKKELPLRIEAFENKKILERGTKVEHKNISKPVVLLSKPLQLKETLSKASDKDIILTHAVFHTWINKLSEGAFCDWTLPEIYEGHELVSYELNKRGLEHSTPILIPSSYINLVKNRLDELSVNMPNEITISNDFVKADGLKLSLDWDYRLDFIEDALRNSSPEDIRNQWDIGYKDCEINTPIYSLKLEKIKQDKETVLSSKEVEYALSETKDKEYIGYLNFKVGNTIHCWKLNKSLENRELDAEYLGVIENHQFELSGKIPTSKFNPTSEELSFTVTSLGKARYDELENNNFKVEFLSDSLKGTFKGTRIKGNKWKLVRDRETLSLGKFVLQEHIEKDKMHWDLRFATGKGIDHFTVYQNPLENPDRPHATDRNFEKDTKYFNANGEVEVPHIGKTMMKIIDSGLAKIVSNTPNAFSVVLNGSKLKGYFAFVKTTKGWLYHRARIGKQASQLSEGFPNKLPYTNPPLVMKNRSFELELYDRDYFERIQPFELENLPKGVWLNLGSYKTDKGNIALIQSAEFDLDLFSERKAREWLSQNKDFLTSFRQNEKIAGSDIIEKLSECPYVKELIDIASKRTKETLTSPIELTEELKEGKKKLIKVKALAEGTWNGTFFPYEDIEKSYKELVGHEVRVNHDEGLMFGKVVKTDIDPVNRCMYAWLDIEDDFVYSQVLNGKINGVSVKMECDHVFTNRGQTATNFKWEEISLVSNPACKVCHVEL